MTEINWDNAIEKGKFVGFEDETMKKIVITNWRLNEVTKEFQGSKPKVCVEFQSECIEEDGEIVTKEFNTTSNRLKKKLRGVLEDKDPTSKVKLAIMRVGKSFDTNYSLKEVKA